MKTLALGIPPVGTVMHLSESNTEIPSSLRERIRAVFDSQYPSVYILAAFDPASQFFGLTTRSREVWLQGKTVHEIVISSTLPAKGWGSIDLGVATQEDSSTHWMISAPNYSESAHEWLRAKAVNLASLLNCTVREEKPLHDA